MRTIIMFCGYIGSGKDSASNYFVDNYGFTNVKMSGDLTRRGSLKKIVWEMYDLDPSKVEDRESRELPNPNLGGETPRRALQYFGHMTRMFTPDVWVDNTVRYMKTIPDDNIVITDIRYPNEYHAVKKMENENTNVVMIAIDKPDLDMTKPIYSDPSELSISDLQKLADYKIVNDSTLEDFMKSIETVSKSIETVSGFLL